MIVSGGTIERVTIAKNFFAHNEDRNPYVRDARDVEIVNNYIYNYGDSGMRLSGTITSNVVGNYFEAGVGSPDRAPLYLSDGGAGESKYFLDGNLWTKGTTVRSGDAVAHSTIQYITPDEVLSPNVSAIEVSTVKEHVLRSAGASHDARNGIDAYLIETALRGNGGSIDSLSQFPMISEPKNTVNSTIDSDNDGMPDWFEDMFHAVDVNRYDSHEDADGDGFTNLEEYINGLIDGFDMG